MAIGLNLGNLLVHLRADVTQFNRALDSAVGRMRATADRLTSIGKTMTMRVTAPIIAMGALATKSFASFDDAMTKSLAIMGDVAPRMREEMEQLAITISKRSVTSATDLARSYFYLASAGLSAEQSIAALSAVERFAVAGAFDMALATDLVTDAQSALGLTVEGAQKNLKNMIRVTDVLIGANTLANASTQQFSEALIRAGPAMKAYNIKLEEGTAVLAAYADQGKKAAEGGELFGRMLRLMIKGFIDNRVAWDRFSISIVDADDKMRPLADIIRDLTNLLGGMGVIQKATTLEMLGFQARSQQTILPLLGLGDAIELYNEKLLLMRGITKEIYEKQLKSFSSQMKILWRNIEAVGIEIGGILAPVILKLNAYILRATELWSSLNESTQRNILLYAGIAAAIGPVLLATGLLLKTMSFMIITVNTLTVSFIGLGAAIATPLVAVLALVAIAYVLRVAWVQNLSAIKDRMQEWFDAFEEGFTWLVKGPIGETVKFFAKSWVETFNFVRKQFGSFLSDLAGAWAGARAWIKGEDWAEAFVGAKEGADKALADFNKSVVSGYKTTALYLSAFGEATVEHLEDLMEAVKIQFGKDADTIINLIKSKISTLQTPMDELREASEAAFGEKMLMDEVTRAIENVQTAMEKTTEAKSEGVEIIERMLRELDTEYNLLGKINEERKRAIRLEKFRNVVVEEHKKDLEKINELMVQYEEGLNRIAEGLRGWSAFTVQMKQWHSDATNLFENLGEIAVRAFDGMANALTNMVVRGKADFKALALSVLADLTRMIIKMQMAQMLGLIFPSLTTPLFGGGIPTTPTSTVFTSPHGGPTVQRGGEVERTGWAVIHKGEKFSGVSNEFNIGGLPNVIINNYTSAPIKQPNVSFDGENIIIQIEAALNDRIQHRAGPLFDTIKNVR